MPAIICTSFSLAMLASVLMFLSTWLEMRVNIGWVFFGLSGLLFFLLTVIKPLRRICATFRASSSSLAVSLCGIWMMLGVDGMKVIPASIIREGLMMPRLPFTALNTAMIAAVAILLALAFMLRGK